MWNNDKIVSLIEKFRAARVLWDTNSKEYKDRAKKRSALKRMAEDFNTDVDIILMKIKSLRTQFRREFRKIHERRNYGGTSPYRSSWFGYEHLLFLVENDHSRYGIEPINGKYENEDETTMELFQEEDNDKYNVSLTEVYETIEKRADTVVPTAASIAGQRPHRRLDDNSKTDDAYVLMRNIETPAPQRDDYTLYGEYVASRLRNANQPHRAIIIAKHQIENILFRLEMGAIKDDQYLRSSSSSAIRPTKSPSPPPEALLLQLKQSPLSVHSNS